MNQSIVLLPTKNVVSDRKITRGPLLIRCSHCDEVGVVNGTRTLVEKRDEVYRLKSFLCRCDSCHKSTFIRNNTSYKTDLTLSMLAGIALFGGGGSFVCFSILTGMFYELIGMSLYYIFGAFSLYLAFQCYKRFPQTIAFPNRLPYFYLNCLNPASPKEVFEENEEKLCIEKIVEKEVEVIVEKEVKVDKYLVSNILFSSEMEKTRTTFSKESHLKEYLYDNIDVLFHEDLEIRNKYKEYKTKVGNIDIFVIDEYNNAFIIELKKSSSSDKTVGQIQRYMTAIREKFDGLNTVKGIIITANVTEKLNYSALENDDILVFAYGLNFQLHACKA